MRCSAGHTPAGRRQVVWYEACRDGLPVGAAAHGRRLPLPARTAEELGRPKGDRHSQLPVRTVRGGEGVLLWRQPAGEFECVARRGRGTLGWRGAVGHRWGGAGGGHGRGGGGRGQLGATEGLCGWRAGRAGRVWGVCGADTDLELKQGRRGGREAGERGRQAMSRHQSEVGGQRSEEHDEALVKGRPGDPGRKRGVWLVGDAPALEQHELGLAGLHANRFPDEVRLRG
mmetsp:Transcript_3757/g.12417  ORF Transcript_3757/g.12417 Transcript_3757/m.12417 type:complete len:229 (+) Transcript_3757:1450-2136(+)